MVAKNIKYVIRWLLKIKNSEFGYFVIEYPLSILMQKAIANLN